MIKINRRRAIRFALAALPAAWLLWPSGASAQQAFRRFFPFLIDLDGWQGRQPDGMSMEMGNTSMLTATREYERGSARLHAAVVTGPAATGALAAGRTGMNIETADGHLITTTIGGLTVIKTFNSKDKSGAIMVALGASAMFSLSYNSVTEDEVLPLAQKFDWKAIQVAAEQK